MKLASLTTPSSPDGLLCVVNRNLTYYTLADAIAPTMQAAIEHWDVVSKPLASLYDELNDGHLSRAHPFNADLMSSPLPRAYQWLDGSAYVNHVELVRKARGAEMPKNFWTDPLMYQGGSDSFISPTAPIQVKDEAYGIDFESEVAVVTHHVPMGTAEQNAQCKVCLLMLVNDVSLRNLIPDEIAKGFGFLHSKPPTSFSPVAITPDELGKSWDGERVHLPLKSYLNDTLFGEPNAGVDMTFSFPQLIAHAAKTRPLSPGTIIGSGTVSNLDRSKGSSCIAEKRMLEIIDNGSAQTPFMTFGDSIRIEMHDANNHNLFGAINQTVERAQ